MWQPPLRPRGRRRPRQPAMKLLARVREILRQPLEQVPVAGGFEQPELVIGGEQLEHHKTSLEAGAQVAHGRRRFAGGLRLRSKIHAVSPVSPDLSGTLGAVSTIRIPPQLADAVDEDDYPERLEWLAALPERIRQVASRWELELDEPYVPGGQCAWVAPATDAAGNERVVKVGWRHREAEHEADALRFWDGDGAVRCIATQS